MDQKGIFLVEALMSLAVLSLVVLVLVSGYRGSSRALNQSQTKKLGVNYAQGEIQKYVNMAHVPTGGTSLTYANIVPLDEQAVDYPEQLMGNEALAEEYSRQRIRLYRKVDVTTVSSSVENEHKVVTVTLRDTQAPPRFPPITLQTHIRKPHALALDTRQAADTASLNVQALALSGNPIPVVGDSPNATLTTTPGGTPQTRTLSAAGTYNFVGLNTLLTCAVRFFAIGFWDELRSNISLSAGANNLPAASLQPVYYGTVNVDLRDPAGNPLSGATAALRHIGSASYPALSTCCGVNFTPDPNYTQSTNASGRATFSVPIPTKADDTYPSGWRVNHLSMDGYFKIYPYHSFTINRNTPINFTYTLYPKKYASLTVRVRNQSGAFLNEAYVRVMANNTPVNNYELLVSGQNTDVNGQASFSGIPINWEDNLTNTVRSVRVRVQRIPYRLQEQVISLTENQTSELDVTLEDHSLVVNLTPISTANNRAPVNIGAQQVFNAETLYCGHTGRSATGNDTPSAEGCLNARMYTPIGFLASPTRNWTWTLHSNGKGYLSSNSSNCTCSGIEHCSSTCDTFCGVDNQIVFTAQNQGDTQLDVVTTYSFTPINDYYGPAGIGAQTMSESRTAYIQVNNGGGTTATLGVAIGGPGTITPGATPTYTAAASYGGNPLPPDVTYSWSIVSGPGALNSTNASSTVLNTAGTPDGSNIVIQVVAYSATLGQSASAIRAISVNYMSLGASVNCPADSTYEPYQSASLTVTPSGGSGSYAVDWDICDTGGLNCANSAAAMVIVGDDTQNSVNFQTQVNGQGRLVPKVTDTTTSAVYTGAYCAFTVQPPGTSN